jgi:hypothetical protein
MKLWPNDVRRFSSTLAISNAGESANMKVNTLYKLTTKRKVKCLEIQHYAYSRRWQQ